MIYECKNSPLYIIGVEHLKWKAESYEIEEKDHAALTFRIEGNATIRANGKTYFVNKNDVLYLPQGVGYTAEYSDTEMLAIHFKTAQNEADPEVYSFKDAEQIYQIFLNIDTIWKSKELGFKAYAMSQLYDILGKLCKNEITSKMPQHFINAVEYINANYVSNALSVEKVCKTAGIDATTLRKLFKKHYQKTPIEYITKLRLEYARGLISNGMSIEQVAEKSGFNDSKYFARVVKKYFNCTPHKLRLYGK